MIEKSNFIFYRWRWEGVSYSTGPWVWVNIMAFICSLRASSSSLISVFSCLSLEFSYAKLK